MTDHNYRGQRLPVILTGASYWLVQLRNHSHLLFTDGVYRSFRLSGQTVFFPD